MCHHHGPFVVRLRAFDYSDVIWASWRLKSPVFLLFVQRFVNADIKENIKAYFIGPLGGEPWSCDCFVAYCPHRELSLSKDKLAMIRGKSGVIPSFHVTVRESIGHRVQRGYCTLAGFGDVNCRIDGSLTTISSDNGLSPGRHQAII